MAQQENQKDRIKFCCSICLDLLKDPVTIPCGHNYCMSCIKSFWNGDQKKAHSCPQCRRTFPPRTVLVKNTMLAELVEELNSMGPRAPPADHCYADPGDVTCDLCTGRKTRALKSCLVCLASYCEQHIQPHYESPAFKKHKLVNAAIKLQETICSRHDEAMKIFCRTDQQCICYLCSMDEHKGHDTIPAEAERAERQKELSESRRKLQQGIQDREIRMKVLQQEMETINLSADKAAGDTEKSFTRLIHIIEKRMSDVKQQIRSRQETEVKRLIELQEKLRQELSELKRKDTEIEQLSNTEDHTWFLCNFPSVSGFPQSTGFLNTKVYRLLDFEDVIADVIVARDEMLDVLYEKWPQAEPKNRADFLQYSRHITLDPNTPNTFLVLSEGNRRVTYNDSNDPYPQHPDRFTKISQVLSKEGLTGRCYWEVEKSRNVTVALAYKSISRSGTFNARVFGHNAVSWALHCSRTYTFIHNNVAETICGPPSSRIGVYLNHSAGILAFYSVSDTMSLLHRVQTTFTEPLYVGLWVGDSNGDTAVLCEPKVPDFQKCC